MLNNKGMTLVELIVTFSLLLIIVVGMFNLIMDVKFNLDDKQIAKDFTEYSATISNDIHYDLLTNEPFAIIYKNKSTDAWTCKSNVTEGCVTSGGGVTFKNGALNKPISDLNTMCSDIYPCAVYAYIDSNAIKTQTIALNKGNPDATNELLKKHGIKYNGVYESLPDQDFVEIRDETFIITGEEDDPSKVTDYDINIRIENDLFIIDFPFFLIEHDKNYGFRIAYPFYPVS